MKTRWLKHSKALKTTPKRPVGRRRRKKGELTKLKAQLWQICRQIRNETTCYTCGKENLSGSSRQLGHFIAASISSPELRYDLKNLQIQCYHCNINLSGATLQFQENLIRDNGVEYVAELWLRNRMTKEKVFPIAWYQQKIKEYSDILGRPSLQEI